MKRRDWQTFSELHKLNKQQFELDFVDVPVSGQDIRLFIDPYSIARHEEAWLKKSSEQIYDFFDQLLDLIKLNKRSDALRLLDGLHESNETRLGYSPANKGAGIGKKQSIELYSALRSAKALDSLKDIEEFNLMIPGIDRDKVSDMTTNIIKLHLIEYTQIQCELYGIKTIPRPIKNLFDPVKFEWYNDFKNLPVDSSGKPVILVPKSIVRVIPSLNAEEYYQKYILEYLQEELYSAGSSLGRLLKNDKRARPAKTVITEEVTKVGQGEGKKSKKEYIYEFSLQNPEVLDDYETIKAEQADPLSNIEIEAENNARVQDYNVIIGKIKAILPGRETAGQYHDAMIGALNAIFYPLLTRPKKEAPTDDGIKRIDISYINSAKYGFFSSLRNLKGIPATYVFVECKNYWNDISNPEVDQLATRFGPRKSKIGFLVFRDVADRPKLIKRVRAIASNEHGYILPFNDADIFKLLKLKLENKDQDIDNFLEERFTEIVN
ncbi:MAG: Uncharacterized protein JWO54_863 [Candidatus Saccharibacteria bacterium]|nr:Uncharacterized protein [Candidatus Saccharibacteria bacterium]